VNTDYPKILSPQSHGHPAHALRDGSPDWIGWLIGLPSHAYLTGALAALMAAAVRWIVDPVMGDMGHYITFYAAIALMATVAGKGPAILTWLLGGMLGFSLFVCLPGRFDPRTAPDYFDLGLYLGIGYLIVALGHWGLQQRKGALLRADTLARINAQLRDSEERFHALADNMYQLAWIADRHGSIMWYNRRWLEYTGTTPGETCDLGWKKLTHADHIRRVLDGVHHSFETGQPWEDTFPMRGNDGSYRWFLARAVPIEDDSGQIARWFGTASDIHEHKLAEEALRNEHRRKDEFLAVLGHELRNPLTPIRNAAYLLHRAGAGDPLVGRSYEILDRQVTQLSRLVDDLMDVTRISRGKVQLKRDLVDLTTVLREFVQDYQAAVEDAGLRFELCFPEDPLWVSGDAARIQQIIGNLLHNALKFTDSGGKISLSLGTERGENALIIVEDTGIGINPEMLSQIFEPFTQVPGSVNRSRGGLGLGLALVKGLTELHGGSVNAEARGPGCGSRFLLRLPLEKRAPAFAQPLPETRAASATCRVLIIEDNHDAAESLQLFLSALGHEVVVAHSGSEGLRAAQSFRPAVIFCDIGLPGEMDGYQVAAVIRADPELSSAFLVALTGFGQEDDRRRAADAGFDRHLTKPARLEVVEQLVARQARR
jgi:PAS domain S-box-containing protein